MDKAEVTEVSREEEGLITEQIEGREVFAYLNGRKFARYPIKTRLILFDEDLIKIIKEYSVPHFKEGDLFCIASKVVSITRGFYVKEEDVKVGWLARFLVRFVKKWPDDPGFAVPRKIQLAIREAGWLRFSLAVFIGGFLKLIGIKGWFYRIAGHNVNAIDGFLPPEFYPPKLRGYGFLAPKNPEAICNEIEEKLGMPTIILDGNFIDNNICGVSKSVKERFNLNELETILKGNPQGQSGNTPMLIIREIK